MSSYFSQHLDWIDIVQIIFAAASAIFMVNLLFGVLRIPGISEPIPVSHKIAVIGRPGAGKTTLITALFELIQKGMHVDNVRLHGASTINTVNKNVARLNSGMRVGPTKERDTFVFRFSYIKRRGFLKRSYDVEIADFPGEYSSRIETPNAPAIGDGKKNKLKAPEPSKQKTDPNRFDYTLFNDEFFSWIASSREYLFLIDLGAIYSNQNVKGAIADISARIRTSWQVIEDATSERGIGSIRNRDVHLVFSKTDTLLKAVAAGYSLSELVHARPSSSRSIDRARRMTIGQLRTSMRNTSKALNLATIQKVSPDFLSQIKMENEYNFSDLIDFFKKRSRKIDTIYTSMTILDKGVTRRGVREVLTAVLP